MRSIVFTKPFSLVFTTAWYSVGNRFPSIRTSPVGVVVHAIVHVGATLCNSAKSTATTRRHEGQQQKHSDDALHHFEILFYDMFCVLKHKEHYHLHENGRISSLRGTVSFAKPNGWKENDSVVNKQALYVLMD